MNCALHFFRVMGLVYIADPNPAETTGAPREQSGLEDFAGQKRQ
jgi:hypothetical protein